MTATTAPDTQADYDDADAPGICWECGGPCLTHKGSVHRWPCQSCIDRYEGAARWAARSDKAKERVSRTLLHNNDNRTLVTANGQRQEGGGSALCTAPPSGADRQERAAAPSYVPRRSDDHHQEGLT